MKKEPPKLKPVPPSRSSDIFFSPEVATIDPEFDEADEQVLFQPPVMATRHCGGRLTRLDDDPEDDD